MARVALTGGAYTARSLVASAQRSLNLYAEPLPEQQGEPSPVAHFPTPGLRTLLTLPTMPVRGIHTCTSGQVYAVGGSTVYSISPTWVATALGTITDSLTTPVSMADNGLQLVIVDGTTFGWTVTLASNAFAPIVDPTGTFVGATRVDYLDTFFLFNSPGTPQFYMSDSEAVTFTALNFAGLSAVSDILGSLIVCNREVWLLGTKATEIWYDYGNDGSGSTTGTGVATGTFPFQRMPGVFIDRGISAVYSLAGSDRAVFWLQQDRYGTGIVLEGTGYNAERISTYAIEAELTTYPLLTDAVGFCYSVLGHNFYVLTFPTADKTWAYDITTKLWHELCWIDANGTEHMHRAMCATFANGVVAAGDWYNGNIYCLDPAVFTDAGQPIKRLRVFPHLLNDGKRVIYRQFLADMESGTSPQETTYTLQTAGTYVPFGIAQLLVPADAFGAQNGVIIDWARGRIWLTQSYSPAWLRSYTVALATQSPILSAYLSPENCYICGDADPVTGNLILQANTGLWNGDPICKYDPVALTKISQFGASVSGFPGYPGSVWSGEGLVCVQCGTVGYAVLKESTGQSQVAVIRTDTMQQAGCYASLVTGCTSNRALICRGASGPSGGSAFLTWSGGINGPSASIPLYFVRIAPGAETYDSTSWPATNPNITTGTAGTIAAASVAAGWTVLQCNSIGYDQTDGNVIMDVSQSSSNGAARCIIKVNSATAAVMWSTAVASPPQNWETLPGYSITQGQLQLLTGTTLVTVNTATGAAVTTTLTGLSPGQTMAWDASGVIFYGGSYTQTAGSPPPVAGTLTSFTNGVALIGWGQTPLVPVSETDPHQNDVMLEWSDDRGHTYGNPVGISLGGPGEFLTSLQWQRLGLARDRVFRLTWSTPNALALQGAWLETEAAIS